MTLEDLLEEIVGEIRDEYDVEIEPILDEGQGRFVVSGKADIETLGERLGVKLEGEGFETVGGYVMARLGRVPAAGEVHTIDDLAVEILDAERRRVHRVRVSRRVQGDEPAMAPGSPSSGRGAIHVKAGFVALVGRPNAGKSTLLNRLVGQKVAIVSDKPQTTRTRILGVRNGEGGQIVFIDTPGIHRPLHRLNVRMVDVAVQSISQADVVCAVADATEAVGGGDQYFGQLLARGSGPVVLALNKIDRVARPALLPLIGQWSRLARFEDIVPVSALTGENEDALLQALLRHLPEGEALYPADYLTDQPERAYVGEIVREKVLRHTRDELPFRPPSSWTGSRRPTSGA